MPAAGARAEVTLPWWRRFRFTLAGTALTLVWIVLVLGPMRGHPAEPMLGSLFRIPLLLTAAVLAIARARATHGRRVAVGLVIVSVAGAAIGPWQFLATALAYFTLNVAYSFRLKKIAYVDVAVIAAGFVLRVLAGGFATLGVDLVVGRRVWDEQGMFRLRVGPLPLEKFLSLDPEGPAFRRLAQLTRFYVDAEFDFDIQLVLRARDVPACQLTAGSPPRLGRTTWLLSRPPASDASDAVFPVSV